MQKNNMVQVRVIKEDLFYPLLTLREKYHMRLGLKLPGVESLVVRREDLTLLHSKECNGLTQVAWPKPVHRPSKETSAIQVFYEPKTLRHNVVVHEGVHVGQGVRKWLAKRGHKTPGDYGMELEAYVAEAYIEHICKKWKITS